LTLFRSLEGRPGQQAALQKPGHPRRAALHAICATQSGMATAWRSRATPHARTPAKRPRVASGAGLPAPLA